MCTHFRKYVCDRKYVQLIVPNNLRLILSRNGVGLTAVRSVLDPQDLYITFIGHYNVQPEPAVNGMLVAVVYQRMA